MTYRPNGLPATRMPTALLWGFVVVLAINWASSSIAQETGVGSGKRQYRMQALQNIPFHQLNQATKDKLNSVLQNPSIYRRLPVTTINSDPDYFRFLVRYPEVIVDIWQLMGVTKMSSRRTGPYTIDTDDGVGTISSLDLVYGNDNLHIFYGKGSYEGPVLRKKLYGSCVLILQSSFAAGPDGKPVATNQLDVFLKVENTALGIVAKTIQPIVGTTADHNFVESLKFVQRLNETTERNAPGVQRMAKRLDIDQDVRQKFVEVVSVVHERSSPANLAPAFLGSFTPGGTPQQSGGQHLVQRGVQENKLPRVGSPYKAVSPESRAGVPLSSLDQLVPISGQQNLDSSSVYPSGASLCRPCSDRQVQFSDGRSPTYQAAPQSLAPRAYGFQAPSYTPVYQGQGVNQPPVAYQAESYGPASYNPSRQNWRH